MNHRQGLIALLLLGAVPSIATADRMDWQETSAPSGDYLDVATSFVYHYDAALGAIHLVGVNGALEDYAVIRPISCGDDCVSFEYDAKVAGNRFLSFNVQRFPEGEPPRLEEKAGEGVYGGSLVTALIGGHANTPSGSGRVMATITLDGVYIAWANQTY